MILGRINPDFSEHWIRAFTVSRYKNAQPVCPPGYSPSIPFSSQIGGLLIADTSSYYPRDRSISESVSAPEAIAWTSSGTPLPTMSFGSAFPTSSRYTTVRVEPELAACTSGDWPSASCSRAFAPAATSSRTTS